jgi:hypothetical protein
MKDTLMFNRIFPETIDNDYRGHVLAIWLFIPIVFMKIAISLLHIFGNDGGAQSVSRIPLDSYPVDAAQNIIALFSRMGLDQLILGLVFVLVLVRYRAMLPLMYMFILLGYLLGKGVALMKPTITAGQSGASTPAMILLAISIAGFCLSIWRRNP